MPQRARSETVQTNLRVKETFRRRIERSAEQRGISYNAEVTRRLEESFRQEDLFPYFKAVIDKYQRQGTVLQEWLFQDLLNRGMDEKNAREVAALVKAYLG